MMNQDPVADACVKRGIRRIRAKKADWVRMVNTDRLRVSDPMLCVLAQVFGSYEAGWRELCIRSPQEAAQCGFAIAKGCITRWPVADAAWRAEISILQGRG